MASFSPYVFVDETICFVVTLNTSIQVRFSSAPFPLKIHRGTSRLLYSFFRPSFGESSFFWVQLGESMGLDFFCLEK